MARSFGRICAGFYAAVSLTVAYIALFSSASLAEPGLGDLLYFVLIALHLIWAIVLFSVSWPAGTFSSAATRRVLLVPEVLAAASLLFFLFSYIFATNANMDYVQRFITSGGNLRLALDTETERLLVWVRVFPLVAVDLGAYVLFRIGAYRTVLAVGQRPRAEADRIVRPWAFLLTLLSAFLVTIALPSFASLDGYPLLGWVAFVPLFLVLPSVRPGHALFYGVAFGSFQTLLSSYWLGTFSLVSLQITVLFFLIYYLIFTPLAVYVHRVARWARVLVFPLAWTFFEYLRSTGFLGYPWALAAHSQYSAVAVIQMASVTGVWGVSFLVLLANSALAEFLGAAFSLVSARRQKHTSVSGEALRRSFWSLVGVSSLVGAIVLAGGVALASDSEPPSESRTVRVAQIQQNNDPRKHEYGDTLATLEELTNATLDRDPDLIVWSETAVVPNIRRWSADTSVRRFHQLTLDFLAYQKSLDRWLVTGNDDYEIIDSPEGTQRYEYNGVVLFSDTGERRQTYRKIRLVPFTEYFPYKETLPRIYDMLLSFDVHFWEPGTEQTVFDHPDVKFSTPICYEDVFPDYVREFVLGGAEAIFNVSNDYWSLTEVQAKQHFVAGLFRAVENRRPVLRTTASGLTGQIDDRGRIIQTAPYYEEASLVSDVVIPDNQPLTIYTRFGDYLPITAGGLLVIIWLTSFFGPMIVRIRRNAAMQATTAESDSGTDRRNEAAEPPAPSADTAGESEQTDAPSAETPHAETPHAATPHAGALRSLGKPLGGRRRKRRKRPKTNWRKIWDR